MISKALKSKIEAVGYKMKSFRVEHLEEISNEFTHLAEQGMLDKSFFEDNLTSFSFNCRNLLNNAKSVMVIASPQYKSLVEFRYKGKAYEAVIPPTYKYPEINNKVEEILNGVFYETGFSFTKPVLPLKLLAVRSGLGRYGRNNVCYISGLGSFIRLSAFISDYEFEEDSWGDMKAMESCGSCTVCIDSCPTGAIAKDRFLIHAQKCITNFNEYDTSIPDWINPDCHDSIVGCMKCQAACPYNSKLIDLTDERICFNDEESELILDGCAFGKLPPETRNRISSSGLEIYYHVLPRNMRLLMNTSKA